MKNKSIETYIVTPVFNRKAHTLKFLKSLQKQSYRNYKVIIVDDGSTDGSAEIIAKDFPDVILIQKDKDMYWSKSTNLGAQKAIDLGAKYVVTINNDVELDKDWLKELVECADKNTDALVGSIIYSLYDKNKIWYFGASINQDSGEVLHRYDRPLNEKPVNSYWLTGMGVIIPVKVFNKIGYYDEKKFPQYFGDVDFSLRALQAGYKLFVTPRAIVYNDVSSDSGSQLLKDYKIMAAFKVLFSRYFSDSIGVRYNFYKRHLPKNHKKAFAKYYVYKLRTFYLPYIKKSIKLKLKRTNHNHKKAKNK